MTDVLIWGGGIAGSALAAHLSQTGLQVVVVPRGPGSYPELPGFGVHQSQVVPRVELETAQFGLARDYGTQFTTGEVYMPAHGPANTVQVAQQEYAPRVVVLTDGCDPRIPRSRKLVPECEPDEMHHFAWSRIAETAAFAGITRTQVAREALQWTELRGGNGFAVSWPLQAEVDSAVHISDILMQAAAANKLTLDTSSIQVEIAPHIDTGTLAEHNIIAIGDLTGVVHPLALRRVEISLKIAEETVEFLVQMLQGSGMVHFRDRSYRSVLAPFTAKQMDQDTMQPRSGFSIRNWLHNMKGNRS